MHCNCQGDKKIITLMLLLACNSLHVQVSVPPTKTLLVSKLVVDVVPPRSKLPISVRRCRKALRLEGISRIFAPDDGICSANILRFSHSIDPPMAAKVDKRGRGLQPSIDADGLLIVE